MLLHSDRYYPTQTLIKHGVVIHDAESGDGAAANLISLLKSKGDKPSSRGPGLFYGAGYHAVTDGLGGYITAASANAGPYSAPPLNPTWWHVCLPGFANQTREQWTDALSRNHIRGLARFVVDKWIEDGKTWSLAFLFADQLKRGLHGYTSHYQVSLAWRESTHTDPGPNFPWDILESDIASLIRSPQSQEDDDMKEVYYNNEEARTFEGSVYEAGHIKFLLLDYGDVRRIDGEELADRGHPNVDVNFGIPKSNAFLDARHAPN